MLLSGLDLGALDSIGSYLHPDSPTHPLCLPFVFLSILSLRFVFAISVLEKKCEEQDEKETTKSKDRKGRKEEINRRNERERDGYSLTPPF